jgi:tRNA pseudouridine38-40 synthase
MEQRNIRLDLSYDGRFYYGWQKQSSLPTIQGTLERCLSRVLEEKVKAIGAGRTDAGAHAIRFTANFKTENHKIPVNKLMIMLNHVLPDEIHINSALEVPLDFHSRFSARAREYLYMIINSSKSLPFFHAYAHRESVPLDIIKLNEIAGVFTGCHNFSNFCYGCEKDTDFNREIYHFRVKKMDERFLFFIQGNGFLRGMIRSIIAVCLNYSRGKTSLEEVKKGLNNEIELESLIKSPVPAGGLYFKRALYNEIKSRKT